MAIDLYFAQLTESIESLRDDMGERATQAERLRCLAIVEDIQEAYADTGSWWIARKICHQIIDSIQSPGED